jgi:tetrahydrodipicolinate N-succinyltransferase
LPRSGLKKVCARAVLLQSNYTYNFAPAYNNDKGIGNDLLLAGIIVKVPIFDKSLNAKINSQMLQLEESQNELAKMNDELEAQKNQLQENLVVLENSKSLYENTIANKEQLRQIAIKSYEIEQMSIEDYLKYEDDVVLEKARLYKNETQRWQIIAKLAVIYGIDLNTIVK